MSLPASRVRNQRHTQNDSHFGPWLLTAERAAVHRLTRTAVIADLHLGYSQARRRAGDSVPVAASAEVRQRLLRLIQRHSIGRLIVAGDLVENDLGWQEATELMRFLTGSHVQVAAIIAGNHDKKANVQTNLGVPWRSVVTLRGWRIVHGDGELPPGRLVSGHFHPVLRWPGLPAAACYLVSTNRLILPAFSADAAGVNVLSRREWDASVCHVVADDCVLNFGAVGFLKRRMRIAPKTLRA